MLIKKNCKHHAKLFAAYKWSYVSNTPESYLAWQMTAVEARLLQKNRVALCITSVSHSIFKLHKLHLAGLPVFPWSVASCACVNGVTLKRSCQTCMWFFFPWRHLWPWAALVWHSRSLFSLLVFYFVSNQWRMLAKVATIDLQTQHDRRTWNERSRVDRDDIKSTRWQRWLQCPCIRASGGLV